MRGAPYQKIAGISLLPSVIAISCHPGTFIAVRTDVGHYVTECQACPKGYYQTEANRARCNFGTAHQSVMAPSDETQFYSGMSFIFLLRHDYCVS